MSQAITLDQMFDALREEVDVRGDWDIYKISPDGEVEVVSRKNLIVAGGYDFICDAIGKAASRPGVMSHLAVGSGTAAAALAQTSLTSEITRISALYAHTAGTKTFKMSATFAPGTGTGAITEAAIFNASSGGTMLNRVTFPVMNKGADDTIVAEFTFTLS